MTPASQKSVGACHDGIMPVLINAYVTDQVCFTACLAAGSASGYTCRTCKAEAEVGQSEHARLVKAKAKAEEAQQEAEARKIQLQSQLHDATEEVMGIENRRAETREKLRAARQEYNAVGSVESLTALRDTLMADKEQLTLEKVREGHHSCTSPSASQSL